MRYRAGMINRMLLLLPLLFACNKPVAATSAMPPATSPVAAEQCVAVTPCHGIHELTCGPAAMCTEEYRMGDFCRQWVTCEVGADGACGLKKDPKFDECVACFDGCKDGDQQACDQACRAKLGG